MGREGLWRRRKRVYEAMRESYLRRHGKDLPPDVREFVENAERLESEEVREIYKKYKEKGLSLYELVSMGLRGMDMARALFKLMKVFGPPTNSVSPDLKGVFSYEFRYKGDYFYVADTEDEEEIELDIRMEVSLAQHREPTEDEVRKAQEFASELRSFIETRIPIPYESIVYWM